MKTAAKETVLVADGYGIRVAVERGRLVVDDGLGSARRHRWLSRIERTVRRVMILSDTGTVSLDAVRWCADVGISIAQLDRDGRLLLTTGGPGTDDARLRRAQAAAAGSDVGLAISKTLLTAKVTGQAQLVADLGMVEVARAIDNITQEIAHSDDLIRCRELESFASNAYFGAWAASVTCSFAEQDRGKVPDHWSSFSTRRSPLHNGSTPRNATTPINALLNYAYQLAEVECRLAAITLGLDPGMGIMHTDKKHRDSLALDLLEALRPAVERQVLQLLSVRHFRTSDFHETRTGVCRVMDPLTHELCFWLPTFAAAIAPIAESVAHALASSSPGKVTLLTPLTRANTVGAQSRGRRSANRREPPTTATTPRSCRTCGELLTGGGRALCHTCWPVTRSALAAGRAAAGQATLKALRAAGDDPAQTVVAKQRRQQSLLAMKAAEAEWNATGLVPPFDETFLDQPVLPALAGMPLSAIQQATGLSVSACSHIRTGKRRPHARHWEALDQLVRSLDAHAP